MQRVSAILGLACLTLVGCGGYSSESLIDPQYRTVYVKTFENDTFYRGYEQALTREFVNKLNSRTHLRVAPLGRADSILTGRISAFKQQVITQDVGDNVREMQMVLTVDMTWTDAKTGKAIRAVRGLELADRVKFDLGQTVDTQSSVLFNDVAVRLVEALEAPW